ncbi:hypothetical protein PHSY_003147 [Pseudozyma hubeiensis SY62]|uniref:J domain-containing protein n=1 Tax=Pseudozyma hubeiensis (strain SY62) TaxID=1305764 RepID=R9P2L4_PSEHS|nr:hypothetical protein PHSY_003147 [Pseudozyma hubeiensis SY62]GAC95571.1 hypothetical protein PHSY_003147 [Pseudozyma hubeiensis SY62]
MKLSRFILIPTLLILTLLLTTTSAANWDKDDHEIFELQSALESTYGKSTNFYSLLDIPTSSSSAVIKRAYRKKSLELHPDKNPNIPDAQQRFERLGLVYKILRDERKDRYDHFLKSGFPKWRRNGYFYERYRPGLGSVLVGIVLVSVAVEMGISRLTSGQERSKIERLKMGARLVAWGPRYQEVLASVGQGEAESKLAKGERKVRVPITGFPSLPAYPSQAEIRSGKVDWDKQESLTRAVLTNPSTANDGSGAPIVDCLVSGADVSLLDKFSGEWIRLDENDAAPSKIGQTWPVRLVQAVVNRFTGGHEDVLGEVEDDLEEKVEVVKEKVAGGKSGKVGKGKKNK